MEPRGEPSCPRRATHDPICFSSISTRCASRWAGRCLESLGSVLYAAWKRTSTDLILLVYALVNYVVISSTTSASSFYPRYAIPIVVVLTIFTGRAIADFATVRWRLGRVGTLAIVCALLAVPVHQLWTTAKALTRPDTRTLAKTWIEANVPAGSKVLIEGGKIEPVRETVPLQDTREMITRRIAYWKAVEPKQARFLQFKRAVHQGAGYELEFVELDEIEPLDAYVARGIEYFVVRPETFLNYKRKAGAGSAMLVESLRSDSRVRLLKRFDGGSRTQLGPTVEIYEMRALPQTGDRPIPLLCRRQIDMNCLSIAGNYLALRLSERHFRSPAAVPFPAS